MTMELENPNLSHELHLVSSQGRGKPDGSTVMASGANGEEAAAPPADMSPFTPREIAIDTLHTLRLYIDRVVIQCDRIPQEVASIQREELFQQLLDSLEVINEGLALSRRILKPGLNSHLDLLEVDLISILRDLCAAAESSQADHRMELIATHLVRNLREWRETGIPTLLEAAGLET